LGAYISGKEMTAMAEEETPEGEEKHRRGTLRTLVALFAAVGGALAALMWWRRRGGEEEEEGEPPPE